MTYEKAMEMYEEFLVSHNPDKILGAFFKEGLIRGELINLSKTRTRKAIDSVFRTDSLVIVDGESCSGKTTASRKLANQYDYSLVDIDMVCENVIMDFLRTHSRMECIYFMSNYEDNTNEYLRKNLQEIVRKSKNGHNGVILTGMFLDFKFRKIIIETIGKAFSHVNGIVMHEKSFDDLMKNVNRRNSERKFDEIPNERQIMEKQYNQTEFLISSGWAAIGFELVVAATKDDFNYIK